MNFRLRMLLPLALVLLVGCDADDGKKSALPQKIYYKATTIPNDGGMMVVGFDPNVLDELDGPTKTRLGNDLLKEVKAAQFFGIGDNIIDFIAPRGADVKVIADQTVAVLKSYTSDTFEWKPISNAADGN